MKTMTEKDVCLRMAHLRIGIFTLDERLSQTRKMINRLSKHKCKVKFSFTIEDIDQKAINESQRTVDMLNADQTIFGPIPNFTDMPPDVIHFKERFDEPLAIRILNILYEAELKQQDQLKKELDLLNHSNPIYSIHTIKQ